MPGNRGLNEVIARLRSLKPFLLMFAITNYNTDRIWRRRFELIFEQIRIAM